MFKKHIFLIFLSIISLHGAFAQFKPEAPRNIPQYDEVFWQWGYYFGLTYMGFKTTYTTPRHEIYVYPEVGFNVGLTSDFKLTRMWSFRTEPGLIFAYRKLIFNYLDDPYDRIRYVRSSYIFVPALIKFNALRNGNFRPYVTGGIIWAYNLNSFENSVNDNASGIFRLKRQSWMWTVGMGFEMYLYYFKFTPSIRGVFSMTNEFVPDTDPQSPWTRNLEFMGTQGVYLVLTFE
ncbi:MAG: PorT family protein [Chlorobi bacterium]|nr:PorT family protein [Chlorobiota bacterium]